MSEQEMKTQAAKLDETRTPVSLATRIDQELLVAMKARDERRVRALRMVKLTLRTKEIDKREPLTDGEQIAALTMLIKQRQDSIEVFTRNRRPDLAEIDEFELAVIESFMPPFAGEDEVRAMVQEAIEHVAAANPGVKLGQWGFGRALVLAQEQILARPLRVDSKMLAAMVKAELNRPA